jgi:RHS repeat-associated protein
VISGTSVSGNDKVWRKFTFTPLNTSKIRVKTTASVDGYSRITEVEAYGPAAASGTVNIHWLITDHLGTPRMILDQTGALANMKRHDYLPFGDELFAPTGGRSAVQGYVGGDGVRQQFTLKERDIETGLDFFDARYYASAQGRFTSADPYDVNMERQYAANDEEANAILKRYILNPQHWNHYAYVLNNPLKYTDPTGETEEEIVVRLNIVYDKRTIRTEEEAKKLAGAAISDAQKVYGTIGIKLEVTFTAGTATGSVYQSPRQIAEGRVEGAVNAFISQDRTSYTGAVYDGTNGDIFLNYGTGIGSYGNPVDLDVGALSHELGHKFGVNNSAGYDNYTADSVIDNANAKLRRGERIEYYQLSSWFYMGGLDNSAAARGQVREIPAVKTYRTGAKRFAKK